jgi:hypothetical protein
MLIVLALAVMLTWAVCYAVLIGIGSVALRSAGNEVRFGDAAWAGLVVAVAFLIAWNLFLPMDWRAEAALAGAGLCGAILNRTRLLKAASAVRWPRAVAGLVIALVVALRACGPCVHGDTFGYGATAVRWILTYPTVPGLANLHGRLGFNSAVHLCIAALDQGPWRGLSFHLFDGLILILLWMSVLPACFEAATNGGARHWFAAILLIPLFYWTTRDFMSAMNTDMPGAATCLMAALLVFDDQEQAGKRLPLAIWLCTLAICFKLSYALLALMIGTIALARLWRRGGSIQTLRATVLAILMLGLWMARGVILSGYPLYPLTIFPMPVDWRAPASFGLWDQEYIRSWARTPRVPFDQTLGWQWLGGWFKRIVQERPDFLIALGLAAAAAIILLIRRRRPRWPLLACSLVAVAFWFFEAPEPRFGEAAVWTLCAVLAAGALAAADGRRWTPGLMMRGVILIAICATRPTSLWNDSYRPLLSLRQFDPLPPPRVKQCVLPTGLVIFIPTFDSMVCDAQLPCSLVQNPVLKLRRPGDLGSGFISDVPAGVEWNMNNHSQ